MSNLTTLSSATLAFVGAVSLALALALWIASTRIGQPRIRFVAAGFFVLSLKSLVIIVTIHQSGLNHEVVQSADGLMDLVAVVLVALPFVLRPQE